MAKGDDAIQRKKNKSNRKKLHKDSSSSAVSARVAAIIASKKRRKSGKRRICEGMCFSLPTPEDPFNERHEKKDSKRQKTKKLVPSQQDGGLSSNGTNTALKNGTLDGNHVNVDHQELKRHVKNIKNEQKEVRPSIDNVGGKSEKGKIPLPGKGRIVHGQQQQSCENSDCPSKFLILCLKSIQSALQQDVIFNFKEDKPLFVNEWGVEFWKCYSSGIDILETSGACSTLEQIAWMISTAADTIARKEKEGLFLTSPFLLFLVPSQEKAAKVRAVCKPLKALGIHTVSLHPGASLDHQIHGLKSCEPEFLVATPERLLELISLKAIDISGVSLLVVDGLDTLCKGGYLDMVKSIRQSSGNPHAVVFSERSSCTSVPGVEDLLRGSYCRLPLKGSINNQSACIAQSIHL
ncbi:probable ATP-dependent RNA helicase ddx5 [Vitis riparia]|uniref:probable ATP-dependent RNA helicase ddx5 n=1 Tax=Vitis riparia TaxID=96939 RepID=UPI00155A72F7|nr:probable ATP-dependent RNA helicase ddx5 [Vitis riparia]